MKNIQNVVEYYDELFPVDESQKQFFLELSKKYNSPAKYLRIGCGTGLLENFLAKSGIDVTGLDIYKEILESANLRRRYPNMAIRFFQMSSVEMTHFLAKKFYNIIACLNDKLIYIHDKTLMKKFFFDCKQLLNTDGSLIIQLNNFNHLSNTTPNLLPTRASIRAKITEQITYSEENGFCINQTLENSSGKILPLIKNEKVLPITSSELKELALSAGFLNVNFYNSFNLDTFTDNTKSFVCVIN